MDNDDKKRTGYGKYPFLDDRGLPIGQITPVQWVREDELPEKKMVIDFKRIVLMLIAIVALFVILAFDIWKDTLRMPSDYLIRITYRGCVLS